MNIQTAESALQVRRAELSDLDVLVALRVALLRELRGPHPWGDQPDLPHASRRYFERALPTGQYASFMAEAGGIAIAAAGIFFFERPPMGANLISAEARIVDVYTAPDWRGRGASRLVVQAVIDYARTRGVRRVRLGASAQGRPLYERLGFKEVVNEMELPL